MLWEGDSLNFQFASNFPRNGFSVNTSSLEITQKKQTIELAANEIAGSKDIEGNYQY